MGWDGIWVNKDKVYEHFYLQMMVTYQHSWTTALSCTGLSSHLRSRSSCHRIALQDIWKANTFKPLTELHPTVKFTATLLLVAKKNRYGKTDTGIFHFKYIYLSYSIDLRGKSVHSKCSEYKESKLTFGWVHLHSRASPAGERVVETVHFLLF